MLRDKSLQIARWLDAFSEGLGRIAAWLVLLMVGVGVWNVIGRYVGRAIGQNLTSNALIEIQWYLFALVFFLGAAYTLKQNEHVRVDVFYKNFSRRQKAWINLLGTILFLLPFAVLVIYFSWETVLNSWQILEQSPDPGGLPRYPIKSLIIVSFVLLIAQGISEAFKNLAILLENPAEDSRHGV